MFFDPVPVFIVPVCALCYNDINLIGKMRICDNEKRRRIRHDQSNFYGLYRDYGSGG